MKKCTLYNNCIEEPSVVYHGACNKCQALLSWELEPDPDSLKFYAECCGLHYTIRPRTYKVHVE